MAITDWFKRKSSNQVTLPQLCYDIAYFILPYYAHEAVTKVPLLVRESPATAGPFFYVMACQRRRVEPVIEDSKLLHWHCGALKSGQEYYVLEYPAPPPVDLSDLTDAEIASKAGTIVLAPHFSAIVRTAAENQYFILGQSPMGGGNTLRLITRDGMNCNLGPGPIADLPSFLAVIEDRLQQSA